MWILQLKIHSSLSWDAVQRSFRIWCSNGQSLFDTIFMGSNHRRLQCSQSRFVWKFSGICLGVFAECLFLTALRCGKFPHSAIPWHVELLLVCLFCCYHVLLSILKNSPLKLVGWRDLAFLAVYGAKPVWFDRTIFRRVTWFLIQFMCLSLCVDGKMTWFSCQGLD